MSLRLSILGAIAAAAAVASAQDDAEYDDMGPAAFMWPPDRVWSAAADNTSPCGSVADAGNRTEFPLGTYSLLRLGGLRSPPQRTRAETFANTVL